MLPSFIIIGAQRGGTTSLYNYLVEHPRIAPSRVKEVHYFTLYYDRGPGWYESNFPPKPWFRNRITGEATPYYLFHADVPSRVFDLCPDVRLIALLRDPVARAYSQYRHERKLGWETLSFEEAVDAEDTRVAEDSLVGGAHQHFTYVARGRYAEQLENWWKFFPRDQLLVLRSEDLFTSPEDVHAQTLAFLGVEAKLLPSYERFNAGDELEGMSADVRARLREYFRAHNERLYMLIGRDMEWER